ncbi:MAG: DUF2878 domain-containing protein [Gammaproteobacteria bacterium]|nr:DUF2878 domain-containing protein [Gammaproteobacteria bacterium]
MHLLVNVVAFKIGWMSSVLGAANNIPSLGPLVVMIAILLHLYFSRDPSRELVLVLIAGAIGAIFDSALLSAGWVNYSTGVIIGGVAPYWMIGMWMLFATTLNMAMRWFHSNLWLAALLGGALGPMSYYFGSKIGAIMFVETFNALAALAVGWALLMPLLLLLARRFDGVSMQLEESRI